MGATDTISEADTEAAERLFGMAYTARERAQMAGNLGGQIESAVARRALDLPNDVPTASRFDPRLPGFSMPGGSGVTLANGSSPCPGDEVDIAFVPVSALGAGSGRGR